MFKPGHPITIVQDVGGTCESADATLLGYDTNDDDYCDAHYSSLEAASIRCGPRTRRMGLSVEIGDTTVLSKHAPASPGETSRSQFFKSLQASEESSMERFTATVILDHRTKTVEISVEDSAGNFLVDGGTDRQERGLGEEMPIYTSMPLEIFSAIQRAESVDA